MPLFPQTEAEMKEATRSMQARHRDPDAWVKVEGYWVPRSWTGVLR